MEVDARTSRGRRRKQLNRTRRQIVKREIIRVEPFDSNFEKWGVPVSVCTRDGDMIFVSGLPPFDPKTGELLVHPPFEQQAERCLEELKTALEAAGSDLEQKNEALGFAGINWVRLCNSAVCAMPLKCRP